MNSRRQFLNTLAAAAVVPSALIASRAQAQTMLKQVALTVAFPPGGGTDAAARIVADGLRGNYAETVIVDNRPGASGRIGTDYVKHAPPDGRTFLYTPAFPMVLFPNIYKKLPYDTLKDFVPVAMVSRGVLALSVGPAVPAEVKSVRDFVAWCKANPDKAAFGAPTGSGQHFAGVLFGRAAGMDLRLIGYKGGAPSVTDLLGGHLPAIFTPLAEALPHAAKGKLRILATTGMRRSRSAPEIPTMQEFGYKDVLFQDWSGILAPAQTPHEIVARMNAAVSDVLRSPKVVDSLAKLGAETEIETPKGFLDLVKADLERYRTIIESTGFTGEE